MKTKMILIVAVGFAIFSCSNGRDSSSSDEISGAYAREYSFKVVNPETGSEIGMRTVRDTIFITPKGQAFEVSNHKWSRNDYDHETWKNMEHSDDRPMPTHTFNFEAEADLVSPKERLHINLENFVLYRGFGKNRPYKKINKK